MLHEFLSANRTELIERCVSKVARRPNPEPTDAELEHGIPLFLDQLVKTLRMERMADPMKSREVSGPSGGGPLPSEIGTTAARHGRELLEHGFSVEQVVHDYGDLCQAITDLAFERAVPLEIDEFRTLNRCLDNAIADAVTAFAHQREVLIGKRDAEALNERLRSFAHELRSLIQTATVAVSAIKAGNVGLAGATGTALDRTLIGLRNLMDRSLADVRVRAGVPGRRELIALPDFVKEIQISASLEARLHGCRFVLFATGLGLAVDGDREMLAAAVGNLLQNAFRFTKPGTEASLSVYSREGRVLIEVADHCGGLPIGDVGELSWPSSANDTGKSGLSLCRRSVEANDGVLRVRNMRGTGCIFTIDLPRHSF